MKLKRNNKQRPHVERWHKLICSCGCDHLDAFKVDRTLKIYMDMGKCTCPEGTQHTAMLAEDKWVAK